MVLALVKAVDDYTADCGYDFTTYLGYRCRNEFASVLGIRSSKREPYITALESPIGGEDNEIMLLDMIADENAQEPFNDVIDDMCNQQLHDVLEEAIQELPERNQQAIRHIYYHNRTLGESASFMCCSKERVRQLENKALKLLRKCDCHARLKEFDYYSAGIKGTGVKRFKNTFASSVEFAVMRKEKLEKEYQFLSTMYQQTCNAESEKLRNYAEDFKRKMLIIERELADNMPTA